MFFNNPFNYKVYCWVNYDNGYGFFDFYINARSRSVLFYKPRIFNGFECRPA